MMTIFFYIQVNNCLLIKVDPKFDILSIGSHVCVVQ